MKAKCKDDTHTWRNMLTIDKEYEVIRLFDDPYAGYPMIEIKDNNGELAIYRANRFNLS